MDRQDLYSYIDSRKMDLIADLQSLIRQRSVSARKQDLVQCATVVAGIMKKAGIRTQILNLPEDGSQDDTKTAVPPVVYGEVKAKANANARTLMFYNHYDVQPEDPIELWEHEPYEGAIEGDYIYGRGSSDDKGELITRIKAVEYYLKFFEDVPCNIKFLVEGEEEVGSTHVGEYLVRHHDELACDGVIWEFGYVNEQNIPIITLGMKGLLFVELTAFGPNRDTHSSLAVLIKNPAWTLVQALNTLVDSTGKILITDWYKEVRDLTESENALLQKESFDEMRFKTEYGIDSFLNNVHGTEIQKALVSMPTCNIAGIISGYTGEGSKTIIPSTANVKIDFRLVPEMDPIAQFERLKKYLADVGFDERTLNVRLLHGVAPSRTDVSDPFVDIIAKSAHEVYGGAVLSVSSPATGPMDSFSKILNVPCISIGSTFIHSRIHSPNEFARTDLLLKTTKCMCGIMDRFATQNSMA
ncbi:MAG TPA: M20/M25/M40 family metallo-hydrolase [Nitrososphaeraceae archaeon]|nr:M20/M25/M40 family metallo-hydrolase [Nitrososphaeraceae archaeon]